VAWQVAGVDDAPITVHCQEAVPYGRGAPGVVPPSITLTVTADTATAWRLVVVDPPPPYWRRAAVATPPVPEPSTGVPPEGGSR
jgi:hypothetical protein